MFKKIPDDVEVREGNMVRFDTVVTGRPAPELAWYCNERMVHPDDHHKVIILIFLSWNYNTCTYKPVGVAL